MMNKPQKQLNCIANPEDRRTRKTKKALKIAFFELIAHKPINQITVSELTTVADINRKTFYNHYQDVDQVLQAIEVDYADLLVSLLQASTTSLDIKNPYPFFYQLTLEIQANAELYQLLMKNGEHARLSKIIKAKLKAHLQQTNYYSLNLDQKNADLLLDFLLAGAMSTYEQWFTNNYDLAAQVLAKKIAQLVAGAIQSFIV